MGGDEGADPEMAEEIAQNELQQKRVKIYQDMINDLLTKAKTSYDWTKEEDPKQLKHSKLSTKAKKAHYKTPDYCIITRADSLNILLLELDPLVDEGGILYGLYSEIK